MKYFTRKDIFAIHSRWYQKPLTIELAAAKNADFGKVFHIYFVSLYIYLG